MKIVRREHVDLRCRIINNKVRYFGALVLDARSRNRDRDRNPQPSLRRARDEVRPPVPIVPIAMNGPK
jgi:hypothetical protein